LTFLTEYYIIAIKVSIIFKGVIIIKVKVFSTSKQLGEAAGKYAASVINKAIVENGSARIVLSTGASQFDTIEALLRQDIDWSSVEMFHLDEYVDLPESHPASFRKYLKERFINKINLKAAYLVDGSAENIELLTKEIRKSPIDLGIIGIGENAHIAFNDPPADFNTTKAYKIVDLDDACKKQQAGEGWFAAPDDVPSQAVTMTVYQILKCKVILSCVPYAVKANAVKLTLENDKTNQIPATALKGHEDVSLYLDADSASLVDKNKIKPDEADKNFSFEVI